MAAWLAPLHLVRRPSPAVDKHPRLLCLAAWRPVRQPASNPVHPSTPQPHLTLVPQLQTPDLGARMAHAMRNAFAAGHRRVAIAGTDVPDLDARVAAHALASLETHQARSGGGYEICDGRRALTLRCNGKRAQVPAQEDQPQLCTPWVPPTPQAVFGPADDGGFYLLALSALPDGLFQVRFTQSQQGSTHAAAGRHRPRAAPPSPATPPSLSPCRPPLPARTSSGAQPACWATLSQQHSGTACRWRPWTPCPPCLMWTPQRTCDAGARRSRQQQHSSRRAVAETSC